MLYWCMTQQHNTSCSNTIFVCLYEHVTYLICDQGQEPEYLLSLPAYFSVLQYKIMDIYQTREPTENQT